jgi:hypothetical protein
MYSTDPHAPQFGLSDAARAAGVTTATLKNWLYAGRIGRCIKKPAVVLGAFDRGSRGTGNPRLLSMRTVIQIAVIAELVAMGIEPSKAGPAAAKFTDMASHKPSGWTGVEKPDIALMRLPGQLFKQGITYLVVDRNSARVIKQSELPEVAQRDTGLAVVNLNMLVERVYERLGIEEKRAA